MLKLNIWIILQIQYLLLLRLKNTKKDFLKDASIIIWTTTPWTIPANKALAFNSSIEYSVVEINSN